MGATKYLDLDLETKAIAEICKALGHPARIEIMTLLWKKNNRTCGEIVAQIPLAQSTISKHLLELKKSGLLNVKNVGKTTIFSVEPQNIQILKKYLSIYLSNKTIYSEKETTTVKKKTGTKKHLKQHNYQFPNKKINKD